MVDRSFRGQCAGPGQIAGKRQPGLSACPLQHRSDIANEARAIAGQKHQIGLDPLQDCFEGTYRAGAACGFNRFDQRQGIGPSAFQHRKPDALDHDAVHRIGLGRVGEGFRGLEQVVRGGPDLASGDEDQRAATNQAVSLD